MAYYHKNLEYHEDDTEKHEITEEERKFLRELQKELNTQDTIGQADPRFWVIKGKEKIFGMEDGEIALCNESVTICGVENIIQYIRDEILPDVNELYTDSEHPEGVYSILDYNFGDLAIVIDDERETYGLDELAEWLGEKTREQYTFQFYEERDRIYDNTMFLTETDAEKHLRANHYHYDEDAHTYAMTAWRDPRMEQLIKILRSVKW